MAKIYHVIDGSARFTEHAGRSNCFFKMDQGASQASRLRRSNRERRAHPDLDWTQSLTGHCHLEKTPKINISLRGILRVLSISIFGEIIIPRLFHRFERDALTTELTIDDFKSLY